MLLKACKLAESEFKYRRLRRQPDYPAERQRIENKRRVVEQVFIVSLLELPAKVERCQVQLHHPTSNLASNAVSALLSFQLRPAAV